MRCVPTWGRIHGHGTPCPYIYFFIDTASRTPNAMPNNAANNTRCSGGSRKVMVWAGYQNRGMVFLNTNPHWACQLMVANRWAMGMGVIRAFNEPPHAAMWASVILCNVINTGAKMVFMATDTANATQNLSMVKASAVKLFTASVMPIYSINRGVPLEKIIMAMLMPIPSTPHTIIRGSTPKVGVRYFPDDIRLPNISPRVDSMPNFKKLITMPCEALNALYHSRVACTPRRARRWLRWPMRSINLFVSLCCSLNV